MTATDPRAMALEGLNKLIANKPTPLAVYNWWYDWAGTIHAALTPPPTCEERGSEQRKAADNIAKRVEKRHGTTVCYDARDIILEEIAALAAPVLGEVISDITARMEAAQKRLTLGSINLSSWEEGYEQGVEQTCKYYLEMLTKEAK